MTEVKELLQKIDFFDGLEDKLLKRVAEAAILRQYEKGESIVRQGELGLGLYVIVRGKVKVHKIIDGVEVDLAELGPEQFFAEMSIIDNKPRSATVTTLVDTECLLLTRDSFVTLMQKYPELPIRVARLLAERLRNMDDKISKTPAKTPADGAAAKASAASTNGNGAHPHETPEVSGSTKSQVERSLLRSFEQLYMLKAFTRFSVAVIGCPVRAEAPEFAETITVGHVKAVLVPAGREAEIGIAAYGRGTFNLNVFTPGRQRPLHYGPVGILPAERFVLGVGPAGVTLRRAGEREWRDSSQESESCSS